MKFTLLVELEVDDTTGEWQDDGSGYHGYRPSKADARRYVLQALEMWGGQRHPTDPFFNPMRVSVRTSPAISRLSSCAKEKEKENV